MMVGDGIHLVPIRLCGPHPGPGARQRGLAVPGSAARPGWPGPSAPCDVRGDGGATVAVRLRGRPWVAVLADMIEGVIVTNGLAGADATRARTALWAALEQTDELRAA